MQTVSDNYQSILDSESRDLTDVFELYADTYIPPDDGFDPSDAVARYAGIDITWNGHAYDKQVVSRGDVSRFIGPTINNVSLRFSNVDRTLGQFILNNDVEGMWCVVRRVSRSVTDSSLVLFVGKLDQPQETSKQSCSIACKQFLGSIDYELPLRTFRADDPQGRAVDDPLFEGFRFIPITGTYQYTTVETTRFLFFFKKKKKVTHTEQYSSLSSTPLGDPIREVIGGRVQVEGIPIVYADSGTTIKFLMVASNGEVSDIVNVRNQTRGFSDVLGTTIHKGEPGSTGTQTVDPQFPSSNQYYSGTAYIGGYVTGSAPENVDDAPTVTMIVMCLVKLPDEDGNFTDEGFSDNPIIVTRNFLTASKFLNVPESLIDDESNALEIEFCDFPLPDEANTDRVFLTSTGVTQAGDGLFRRFISTGGINPYVFRFQLGLDVDRPELIEPTYEPFDPFDPVVPDVVQALRKRYTVNATLTDRVKGLDYLYKTLFPAFRGYLLNGSNGKIKIKSKRASDSVLLRDDVLAGDTELPVEDVEYWNRSMQGKILIGVGLPNSEVRTPTGFRYSTAGNSIILSASGGVTASGFSGADDDTPAAATLTVTTDSGTKTVTIDGIAVSYATLGDDTTATVGGMLAAGINSNQTLNRYITASWSVDDPTHVYLQAKLGWLEFDTPLEENHSIEEEVIRVMESFADKVYTFADCTRANIRKDTFRWPLGGREKTINQVKGKFHDSRNDFAETPYELNDTPHQTRTRKILPEEIDMSAIDNVHQASRIARGRYSEVAGTYYEDLFDKPLRGSTFFSWGASARGKSLLLEEGDVVCVTESSGGDGVLRNIPVRLEDIRIPQKGGPDFTGRLYATEMHDETVGEHIVPMPTALADPLAIESPAFDSVDDDVPVVTVAPTVAKVDFQDQWSVYYPNPDSKGYSLVDSEIQVRKADDLSVLLTRPNGRTNNLVISQYPFDCKIRYRWRNQYRESGSDGWSSWSPDTDGFSIGSSTPNTSESDLPTFDQDPNDIFNPHGREVLFP